MKNFIYHKTEYHICPYCNRMIPEYGVCECESIANESYKKALNEFAEWLTEKLKNKDGDFYYYNEFIDEFLLSKSVNWLKDNQS